MKLNLRFSRIILLALAVLSPKAYASNGIYPQAFSSGFGISGAGTALPIEANNVEANPALLSRMHQHWTIFGGTRYNITKLNSSPAPIGNKSVGRQTDILPWVPIGEVGLCMRPNERWAYGLGSAGGGNLVKYDQSIIAGPAQAGRYNRQLKELFALLNPTIAYNVSCNQSYGASLILGVSQLKADIAQPPTSPTPFAETAGNNLASYILGIGARIGGFWVLTDWLNMGASVSTPVWFQANTRYKDVLKHHLAIPAIARIGFDFHICDSTHLLIDFKEIFYREVKTFGSDLGWKNQFIFIIALQQQLTCNLIASVGYNYGRSPIRCNNVLINGLGLSAIGEHNIGGGIRYSFGPCIELFLVGSATPYKTLTDNGTGILGQGAAGTIGRDLEYSGQIGIVRKF